AAFAETRCQPLGQARIRFGMKHVRDMHQAFSLIPDRAYYFWMRMTEICDSKTAEKIEIGVAVSVLEVRSFAANPRDRKTSVDIDNVAVGEVDYLSVVHVRVWRILDVADSLRGRSETRAPRFTTSVPIPERVKTSSNTAWRTRPSMIWVLATPFCSASMQHSTLGIIPS